MFTGGGYLGKAALAAVVASLLTFGGLAYSPVMAADNTAGTGNGVAIGNGSKAPKAENVAIGKGAEIKYSNGASSATGDVIVGSGAVIDNYASQGGSIAIGKNAKIENMTGKQESAFALGQTKYHKGNFLGTVQIPDNPENVAGSIALGDNTYARTGSIMIGSHNYRGLIGDQTVDTSKTKDYGININATTLGTNSFNQGAFSSVTGAYSIISGKYNGRGSSPYVAQNFGATITGSLNSIESATSSSIYSGIANSIVGTANKTSNSNGSLIFGAGNTIKNSVTDITNAKVWGYDVLDLSDTKSAKNLQDKLMTAVHDNKSGGATLVIGGGNVADYTQKTQILGVNNTVTGTENNISDYNMIDGFGNTITGASHLYTIGTNNKITDTKNTILAGDDYTNVSGLTDSVIIGNNRVRGKDDKAEFAYFSNQKNIVSIGNKNVLNSTDGSISIGNNNFMWRSGGQPEKYGYDTGNVAIGNNTYINSYVNQGDSIVIGKNATAINMNGSLEKAFAFGTPEGKDYSGSIAIGQNSYARSGSTMIGIHNYQGKLGDLDIDFTKDKSGGNSGIGEYQESIDATTIGNNSYNNGVFSTVVGSYTAVSGLYHNQKWGEKPYGVQNFGAAVLGSLNSVEGLTSTEHNTAGMADSILGSANRTKNANGTIMVGAGNVVEDSINDFDASEIKTKNGIASPNALSEAMRTSIKNANGGGAAAIVGNGNEVKQSTNVSVLGSKNKLTKTKSAQVLGDNREVTDTEGAVIIGSASGTTPMTTDKKNVTILGYNANATVEGGVALGAGSVASLDSGKVLNIVGYDPAKVDHSTDITGTWKSTAAAVSVGDASKNITRQITNVAAGKELTDAVNVAQLKAAQTHFYSVNSTDETAGNYNNDGAKGKNSLAAGVGALAKGDNSVAIGTNAKAQNDALAVGESASAGNNGIAIGMRANAGYGQNMALGYYASVANGVTNSTALGYGSQVTKRDILKSDGNDGVVSVGRSVGQSGEKGMTRRIINVKAGVNDTDAVNVSQLKQRAQAATTEVVAGTNIVSVTPNDKTADGHTIYTVNAKGTTVSGDDNFNITPKTDGVTNVTDYAISLNNTITIGSGTGTHPITINGTDGVISGLTNTTWDKNANYSTSTKAATEAQLQKAMNDAQKAAEANDTDTHVRAGTYAVTTFKDAAGKDTQGVALDVVDKTNTPVGKVTITDVAKASDVGDVSKLSQEVQNAEGSTTVVEAINNVNTKVDNVDNKVGDLQYGEEGQTNVVTNGDSVTKAIGDLDKAIGEAATEAGKHTSVSTTDSNLSVQNIAKEGEAANYQISLNKNLNVDSVNVYSVTTAKKIATKDLEATGSATIGKVTINADNKGTIGGLTNKIWDAKNITSGQAATEDQLQAATKNAVNYDGDDSQTVTLREDTTIKNVANTTIEEGSKNAVNAGTVYKETRVEKDGIFIRQANTAGENLTALDHQVAANTESIYNINNRVSDLDNRVNKVGAGAAALAALHPLDFDPDDKWDFAVGYGNYRNANSVAFGAFYRPNEDTMFSLGTNFGNGENMFNAGLSFKIGQGGSGITTSKTAMARKIESLEDTVDKQDKKIAELEALVKEQGEMIRQYVGKK